MSWIQDLKNKAMGKVYTAIKQGKLTRPDSCSLCGSPSKTISYPYGAHYHSGPIQVTKSNIVAHHWKGYEEEVATDVLWICHSCNLILSGPEYHDGSLSFSELRQIISDRKQQ